MNDERRASDTNTMDQLMKSRWLFVLIGVLVAMLLFGVWYLRSASTTTFTVIIRDDVTSTPVPGIPTFLWDGSKQTFPGSVLARFEKPRLPTPSDAFGRVTLERPRNTNREDRLRYKVAVVVRPNWQLIRIDGDLLVDDEIVVRIVRQTSQSNSVK